MLFVSIFVSLRTTYLFFRRAMDIELLYCSLQKEMTNRFSSLAV